MLKSIISLSLAVAITGCSAIERIEPTFPVNDEPTAVETGIGVASIVALVSGAVLLFSLAAAVNDAGS